MTVQQRGPCLEELYELFGSQVEIPQYREISGEKMPQPYRRTLVHTHHMTVTLEQFHECRVDLQVLQTKRVGDHYGRMILLSRGGTSEVVQFGIMRIDLSACSEAVAQEIVEGKTPLGRILIQHNVLRHIEPHRYLELTPTKAMLGWLGMAKPETIYGRLGTIYCNELPAVEVLEVLRPEP